MKIKFIDSKIEYGKYNVFDDDDLAVGRFWCSFDADVNGKKFNFKREILVVKQRNLFLNIYVLLHELSHALVDLFYPANVNHKLHGIVDKYLRVGN